MKHKDLKHPTNFKEAFKLICNGENISLSNLPSFPELNIEDILNVQPITRELEGNVYKFKNGRNKK